MSYTIIASFRNDNQDGTRLKNLHSFLNYYNRLGTKTIIIQQDIEDRTNNIFKDYENVHHVLVYNAGLFNKSWGYNVGVNIAREYSYSNIYMFCDIDIMIPENIIAESNFKFIDKSIVAVNPYMNIWHLNREQTHDFCYSHDWSIIKNMPPKEQRGNVVYAGGCIFISDSCLTEINGWDEEYRGWGGEDNAMGTIIIRKYGTFKALSMIDGVALHLWHTVPSGVKSKMEHDHYLKNKQRLEQLWKTDVDKFINGRVNIAIGNTNKYISGEK